MATDNTEEDAAEKQEADDRRRTIHLIDDDVKKHGTLMDDERTPLKNKDDPTPPTLCMKLLLIAFAFTGNTVVMTVYGYPSGFLLEYLTDAGINESVGESVIEVDDLDTIVAVPLSPCKQGQSLSLAQQDNIMSEPDS